MTLGDWIDIISEDIREEVTKEVREEVAKEVREEVTEKNIKALIEILQEDHIAKENIIAKIQTKFPEYADRAEDLVERYWIEH